MISWWAFEWHVAYFIVGQVHAIKYNHQGNMAYVYRFCNAAGNSSPEITFVVMLTSSNMLSYTRVHLLTLEVILLQPKQAHTEFMSKVLVIIGKPLGK